MAIFDLFSKRQKRERGEMPDVYIYDQLPMPLRGQIVHIIKDAFGCPINGYDDVVIDLYNEINQTLCREYGYFKLPTKHDWGHNSAIDFFLDETSVEKALDVVELCFFAITDYIKESQVYRSSTKRAISPADAVAELNERFKEHGIGYAFEAGRIIRIDSEFLHAEAVKPALTVLHNKKFKGANEEFLKAHDHYRHGNYKECLSEALKAFESTMKVICTLRGWDVQPNDGAKKLIEICLKNGLLPSYSDSQLSSVRSLLASGVPTIRNKNAAHGQGAEQIIVPEHLARYALNLTATNILFMVEAHQATK